jgi:hypothetical protein
MMKSEVLLAIFAFYGCHNVLVAELCEKLEDSDNYTAIERLILTESNLIKLEGAFFPTNLHPSIVVDVNYHFNISHPQAKFKNQQKLKNVSDLKLTEENPDTFKFRWMASPVNLLIRPSLLKKLSLFTYQVNVAALTLEFEVTCETELINKSVDSNCQNVSQIYHQLNNMTSNVSQMALVSSVLQESG